MKLNNQEIQHYHRHRFPYLLVDCVEDIEPGKYANGYKNFTEDEWLFHCNLQDDEPVPFTMLIEVLTEIFLLPILMLDDNAGKTTNFIGADEAKLFCEVYPGDRLNVKTKIKSYRFGVADGVAEGFVGDKLVCSAKLKFVIPDVMEKFRPKGKV